jgi:hypothetical protein
MVDNSSIKKYLLGMLYCCKHVTLFEEAQLYNYQSSGTFIFCYRCKNCGKIHLAMIKTNEYTKKIQSFKIFKAKEAREYMKKLRSYNKLSLIKPQLNPYNYFMLKDKYHDYYDFKAYRQYNNHDDIQEEVSLNGHITGKRVTVPIVRSNLYE